MGPAVVYSVFKHPENGEFVHVASREDSEQVFRLEEEFKSILPEGYEVRDSEGKAMDRTE